ncbi:SCY1-like protein 2 [Nymphalis io]|uniref:SCY1-like protein 2 n=1 Tax=Inachis io TaxID=171585 RepID=UPI00216944DD|nr:SCY1-like protein 2 [Nymphalis io]
MISKLKNSPSSTTLPLPLPLENNPILDYFEIIKETSCAGPCLVWRIHDAIRKSDSKKCSVFFFDKRIVDKLYKPKKKDSMLDRIKASIIILERLRHPRLLRIIHTLEEGEHTLAFATEAVYGSLHNILAWQESSPVPPGCEMPVMPYPMSLGPPSEQSTPPNPPSEPPPFAQEYNFLEIELCFGMLQIIEALHFMHYSIRQIHRNLCPQVIIVTKRGTWKLFGLEFIETVVGLDPTDNVSVPPWSTKVARICQPNLDFMAPEMQTNGECTILSDMFSLGLIICALYNQGKSLIQANNNPMLYMKQIEYLDQQVLAVLPRIPPGLQEAVQRLLSRDPHPRPSTQLLPLINYFKCQSEPAIQSMLFLDVISSKDVAQKNDFYKGLLVEALPFIPKKLRWQFVWPILEVDVETPEILGSVLNPIMWMTHESTMEEFETSILPALKKVDFMKVMRSSNPEPCQALLVNLHHLIHKCSRDETNTRIMPLLYAAMDTNNSIIQTASLIAVRNVSEIISDRELQNVIIAKVKHLLELNQNDVKVVSLVLGFFEMVLLRLQRKHVMDVVVPTLLVMKLSDADIITRVVKLYKFMILESKFDLTSKVMATEMIPSLAPQAVNPTLDLEQFNMLMEIIYQLLENIDKHQRSLLKEPSVPVPTPERSVFRQATHTDINNPPPFSIPNLRVDRRKPSSTDEMDRKNAAAGPSTSKAASSTIGSTGIGQWFFGSNNSTNNDGNFLRVASVFPNRRLSDNTMIAPKIRIAPSCASSPGGTPGSASGLPTRRHSSIGPQERRGSAVNLSPPTVRQYRGRGGSGSSLSVPSPSHHVGGSMPNTSSSVPFLLTSSMQSVRSRRPSAHLGGSQGSGILHHLSGGMVGKRRISK